jgi:hypothetical protein
MKYHTARSTEYDTYYGVCVCGASCKFCKKKQAIIEKRSDLERDKKEKTTEIGKI